VLFRSGIMGAAIHDYVNGMETEKEL